MSRMPYGLNKAICVGGVHLKCEVLSLIQPKENGRKNDGHQDCYAVCVQFSKNDQCEFSLTLQRNTQKKILAGFIAYAKNLVRRPYF